MYLYESLIKDISKIIKKHLNEAQVDGLKDVKIIRHYTTGSALKDILKSGILIAQQSQGDRDWEGYKLHDDYVVSFHDVRTDPEYNTIIEQNFKNEWYGGSQTLGCHADKICCCIEIDYDKLDKMIQDKTHLLNLYGQKALEFCNLWNLLVDFKESQEEIIGTNNTINELIDLKDDKSDEKLYNSMKCLFDNYPWISLDEPDIQLALEKIKEIFKRNFPNIKDLYNTGNFIEVPGIWHEQGYGSNFFEIFLKHVIFKIQRKQFDIEYYKKELKLRSDFYKRDLKKFTKDESQILAEYAIKFDVIHIVKILRKHGWRFGDSLLKEFQTINTWGDWRRTTERIKFRYEDDDIQEWYDGSLIGWIDKLAESKNRIINADIEIRVGSDIKLDKENCKIVIFKGLCNATKQKSLLKFVKKYESKYNIQYV